MVAGHLLLTLISRAINPTILGLRRLSRVGVLSLIVLEDGVALIQAYVFRILPSLYIADVNSPSINY